MRERLKLIPERPGCYLYKNKDGVIIYVGKAKNLKRRVNSYFNRLQTGKTLALVNQINDFEYIVTNFSTSCASSFPAPQTSLKQFLFSNKSFSINYSFVCISNTKFMILKHTLSFTSKF